MKEFQIHVSSVKDVLEFVSIATKHSFPITVGNEKHRVNGKSFMEMFCLNFRLPLIVRAICSEEEFSLLLQEAAKFVVK